MNPLLQSDMQRLPELLELVQVQASNYLTDLDNASTTSLGTGALETLSLGSAGLGAEEALNQFNKKFKPVMVASSGPRYLGYVTGGTTPAAIVGDWLTTTFDQNSFATQGNGDVSAVIELETIRLLLQLFDLPASFLGGFVSGATMSNFTCLAVARQWAGKQIKLDIAREGVRGPINLLAATPHSSSIKSLSMLGLGSNNCRSIKTLGGTREAIDVDDLENALKECGHEPCILISSGGTVNTVDFDDMQAIAQLKKKYKFWWHIDAAFGAFAACSPQCKHLLQGWEEADSITVDCHKWLNVPYDSAVFFISEKHKTLQVETFQNSNAPYLGDPTANFTYLNFLPENSRRLRALPAWFTLMAYGKTGYREIVENNISHAISLGQWIEANDSLELLAPVRLNTVCFTVSGYQDQPKTIQWFVDDLCKRGRVFMTPTSFRGSAGVRAAFVNWRTTEQDLKIICEELKRSLQALPAAR